MIFDTDILIWVQKGHNKASNLIDKYPDRYISIQTYMELIQCAQNKQQIKYTKEYLIAANFQLLPLTENIGHRAAIYIEEYSQISGLRSADAIIAATAIEHNLPLCSGNKKHFSAVKNLDLKIFIP